MPSLLLPATLLAPPGERILDLLDGGELLIDLSGHLGLQLSKRYPFEKYHFKIWRGVSESIGKTSDNIRKTSESIGK